MGELKILFLIFSYLKEDFCVHVKKIYKRIYHHENMKSNPSLSLQKQRVEVVKQLADAFFFPL